MAVPLPVAANHAQPAHGDAIVFDHKTGNEWWVEVVLGGGASGSVSGVQAMDTGGPWVPLTKQSWGAWAASFHIEPGNQVRFRATWAGGDMADSCWFTHPAGLEQCGSPPPPPPPGTFDATFTGVRGNEWWVQAQVATNGPAIAKVDVSLNGGAWQPVTKQSWGWGSSYHIVQGTIVQLRATATDGQTDLSSCRKWIPPSNQDAQIVACGTPPPPPPPPGFDAHFTNVKGNEWWVEVKVTANQPVAAVDARLGCSEGAGAWQRLTLRSWGSWAASFRVVPGTHVDFRATSTGGATDISTNAFIWPQATPTDGCQHAWPRVSSHADVRFRDNLREFDGEGGERFTEWDGLVHTTWTGSAWDGTCEQRVTRMVNGVWTNTTEAFAWDMPPPKGEIPATVGGTADLQTVVGGCRMASLPDQEVVGRETRTFSIRSSSGDPVAIDAYHAESNSIGGFSDEWWDAKHGLMLDWDAHSSGQHHISNRHGWLLDTDANFG